MFGADDREPELRRRDFLTLIGGSAAAWPLAADAQQAAMPIVGVLDSSSASEYSPFLAAFREGLHEAGFVEGRNVAIEYRWAEGRYDRLPSLATELVRIPVAVLVATGITAAAAAKATTSCGHRRKRMMPRCQSQAMVRTTQRRGISTLQTRVPRALHSQQSVAHKRTP
jgi:hypothetical protein